MAASPESIAKWHLRNDRVLVRLLSNEFTSPGGIVVVETKKGIGAEGVVLGVGPGKMTDDGERIPLEVVPGDHVWCGRYGGTECMIDGEQLTIYQEVEILMRRDGD